MRTEPAPKRKSVADIRALKGARPVVCLTAYSGSLAPLLDPHVDLLLVGDSVAMVHHGYETTLPIALDIMIAHARAVVRSTARALVCVDLPFGSYEETPEQAFRTAARVLKESEAAAVKLEGGVRMAPTIAFLVERGIPVLGHVGLLPQSVHAKGGYRVTGRNEAEWAQLERDAGAVAEAGAFAMVIEGMAEPLAAKITAQVPVPTIGIGASSQCDGQILVTEDMLGLNATAPKFVRRYAQLGKAVAEAAQAYAADVRGRRFPGKAEVYDMADA